MAINFNSDLETEDIIEIARPKISKAMVLFRLKTKNADAYDYEGRFGFDWLREGSVDGTIPDINYEFFISNGYFAPRMRYLEDQAFYAFANLYNPMRVSHNAEIRHYSSFLTLYPDNPIEWKNRDTLPLTSVNLQMGLPYKEKNVSKIELEPEIGTERLIELSPPYIELNKDVEIKEDNETQWFDISIGMKTGKELNKDTLINVWAHYQAEGTQGAEKALAGTIVLKQNNAEARRKIKLLVVPVILNIFRGDMYKLKIEPSLDEAISKQLIYMQKLLAQALIYTDIEKLEADFDLSDDEDFKMGGRFIYETNKDHLISREVRDNSTYLELFSQPSPKKEMTDEMTLDEKVDTFLENQQQQQSEMIAYLEDTFRRNPLYSRYANHLLCFVLPKHHFQRSELNGTEVRGEARKISSTSLAMYKSEKYEDTTLVHELLHCLGLWHTFVPENIPLLPNQKFVHDIPNNEGETISDNLMGYNPQAKFLWQWQKDIIRTNTLQIE